jgi:REP element-mobilizing transposase RayT
MSVLAYHLTWTTYGTWLPGDRRGWVRTKLPGIQPPDAQRERFARKAMAEAEVLLSCAQRELIEQTIHDHCAVRKWLLHAVHARTNHVHVVVTAEPEPDEVRNQFKSWCSRKLSDADGLQGAVAVRAGRRRWFTEGGDVEIIEDEEYLENAIRYVLEGQ